jgi:hypothetical protein
MARPASRGQQAALLAQLGHGKRGGSVSIPSARTGTAPSKRVAQPARVAAGAHLLPSHAGATASAASGLPHVAERGVRGDGGGGGHHRESTGAGGGSQQHRAPAGSSSLAVPHTRDRAVSRDGHLSVLERMNVAFAASPYPVPYQVGASIVGGCEDARGGEFLHEIRVATNFGAWTVRRAYSEFDRVARALETAGHTGLPPFPPRCLFVTNATRLRGGRVTLLDNWLRGALSGHEVDPAAMAIVTDRATESFLELGRSLKTPIFVGLCEQINARSATASSNHQGRA